MTTRFPLQTIFQSAQALYAIIHNPDGRVWNPTLNTGAGDWEAFNAAHWDQYAIALTEQTGSGYYRAAYPAAIGAVLTSEAYYQRATGSPLITDTPTAPLSQSQGQNVAAIAGDPGTAENQQAAAGSMVIGQAAGTPTASVFATDLDSVLAGNYAGRSVGFTSGAAAKCFGRIIGYAADGTITLAAPLAVAPAAGDDFVII